MATTTINSTINTINDNSFSDIERVMRNRDRNREVRETKNEYVQIDTRSERRRVINKMRREKEMKKTISLIGVVCGISAMGLTALTVMLCLCIFKMEFYTYLITIFTSLLVYGTVMSIVYYKLERRIRGTFEAANKAYDRA